MHTNVDTTDNYYTESLSSGVQVYRYKMASLVTWIYLLMAYTAAVHSAPSKSSVELESRLIQQLKQNYVKEARPVLKSSQSVNMSIQLSFVGIDDIDESNNVFTATILLVQMWKDPRLTWNVSKHGGVKTIRLPVKDIWIPDIVPYNTAGLYDGKPRYDETCHVLPDGTVFWVPMITITSKCPMDVRNFPFDTQHCHIILGSWVHSSTEIQMKFLHSPALEMDLSLSEADTAFPFTSHPNWDLKSSVAKLQNVKYTCCDDLFTKLTVSVRLTRKATFYRLFAIGPAAVLGFLVPVLFLLPSRSEGKTTYGMLLIVGMTLLILALENAIPFSHGMVPKIGYFYLYTMGLAACSILISIFISNLVMRGGRNRPLPAWLKWVCLSRYGFRRLFCVEKYIPVDNLYSVSLKDLYRPEADRTATDEAESAQREPVSDLDEIKRYLQCIVGKQTAEVGHKNVCQQWEEMAQVFDRILFVVFLTAYVLIAADLLTSN